MRSREEVARTIDEIVIPAASRIAWSTFGPNGNPCDLEELAYTLAAVILSMPKNGERHRKLAQRVAVNLGNQYVTYPWLSVAVGRLLSENTYEGL